MSESAVTRRKRPADILASPRKTKVYREESTDLPLPVFPVRITDVLDLRKYLPRTVDGRVLLDNFIVIVVERKKDQLYTIKHSLYSKHHNILVLVDAGGCRHKPYIRKVPFLWYELCYTNQSVIGS